MTILTLRPNAVGDSSDHHRYPEDANWKCVDEVVADEDATIVYELADDGGDDLYNLPDHTSETGTINNIKLYVRGKCPTEGGRIYAIVKTYATLYRGDFWWLGAPWSTYDRTLTVNPFTSAAWTWGEIDALQIGVTLVGAVDNAAYCTQVYVEVDYTEVKVPLLLLLGVGV